MSMNSIKRLIKAVVTAIAMVVLLLFVFCVIAYNNADPDKMLDTFSYIIFFAGALVCGVISGRTTDGNKIVLGVLSGAVYIVILFAASFIFGGGEGNPDIVRRILFYAGAVLISALTAGVVGRSGERSTKKVSPGKLRKNTLKKISRAGI